MIMPTETGYEANYWWVLQALSFCIMTLWNSDHSSVFGRTGSDDWREQSAGERPPLRANIGIAYWRWFVYSCKLFDL